MVIDPEKALEQYLRGEADAASLAQMMAERSEAQRQGTEPPRSPLIPAPKVGKMSLREADPDEYLRQLYHLAKQLLDDLNAAHDRVAHLPNPDAALAEVQRQLRKAYRQKVDQLKATMTWVGPEQHDWRKTRVPSRLTSTLLGPTRRTLGGVTKQLYKPSAETLVKKTRRHGFTQAEIGAAINRAIEQYRQQIFQLRQRDLIRIQTMTSDPHTQQIMLDTLRSQTNQMLAKLNDPAVFQDARSRIPAEIWAGAGLDPQARLRSIAISAVSAAVAAAPPRQPQPSRSVVRVPMRSTLKPTVPGGVVGTPWRQHRAGEAVESLEQQLIKQRQQATDPQTRAAIEQRLIKEAPPAPPRGTPLFGLAPVHPEMLDAVLHEWQAMAKDTSLDASTRSLARQEIGRLSAIKRARQARGNQGIGSHLIAQATTPKVDEVTIQRLSERMERHQALLADAARLNRGDDIWRVMEQSSYLPVRRAAEALKLSGSVLGRFGKIPTLDEIERAGDAERSGLTQRYEEALAQAKRVQRRRTAFEQALKQQVSLRMARPEERGLVSGFYRSAVRRFFTVPESVTPGTPKDLTLPSPGTNAVRTVVARQIVRDPAFRDVYLDASSREHVETVLWYLANMEGFRRPEEGTKPRGGDIARRPTEEQALQTHGALTRRGLSLGPQGRQVQIKLAELKAQLAERTPHRLRSGTEQWMDEETRAQFLREGQRLIRQAGLGQRFTIDPNTLRLMIETSSGLDVFGSPSRASIVESSQDIDQGHRPTVTEIEEGIEGGGGDLSQITSFPGGVTSPGRRHEAELDPKRSWTERQLFFIGRQLDIDREMLAVAREMMREGQSPADRGRQAAIIQDLWSRQYLGDISWRTTPEYPLTTVGAYTLWGGRRDERVFYGDPSVIRDRKVINRLVRRYRDAATRAGQKPDVKAFLRDFYRREREDIRAIREAERRLQEMEGDREGRGGYGDTLEGWKWFGAGPKLRAGIRTAPATSPEAHGVVPITAYEFWRRRMSAVTSQGQYRGEEPVAPEVLSVMRSGEAAGQMVVPFNLVAAYLLPVAEQVLTPGAAQRLHRSTLIQTMRAQLGEPEVKGVAVSHERGGRVRRTYTQQPSDLSYISHDELLAELQSRMGNPPWRYVHDPEQRLDLMTEVAKSFKLPEVIEANFRRELDELARDLYGPEHVTSSGSGRLANSVAQALERGLGRSLSVEDVYRPAHEEDVPPAPWPEETVTKQDLIVRLLPRLLSDLFHHEDPRKTEWGQRYPAYADAITKLHEKFRLGAPESMDDYYTRRHRFQRLSRVFEGLFQMRSQWMTEEMPLISEQVLTEGMTPREAEEMMRFALGLSREQRRELTLGRTLEEAVPGMARYLAGLSISPVEQDYGVRAHGAHAPPPQGATAAQNWLEMSAVLNAVFELVASQSDVMDILPPFAKDQEQRHRGTLAHFALSYSQWQDLNIERGQRGEPLIPLAHWMIVGQPATGERRGIGLRGLQTVEDWQRFTEAYIPLREQYLAGKTVELGLKEVLDLVDVLRWDISDMTIDAPDRQASYRFSRDDPNSLHRLLQRLTERSRLAPSGRVQLQTEITKFLKPRTSHMLRSLSPLKLGTEGQYGIAVPWRREDLEKLYREFFSWEPGSAPSLLLQDPATGDRFAIHDVHETFLERTASPETRQSRFARFWERRSSQRSGQAGSGTVTGGDKGLQPPPPPAAPYFRAYPKKEAMRIAAEEGVPFIWGGRSPYPPSAHDFANRLGNPFQKGTFHPRTGESLDPPEKRTELYEAWLRNPDDPLWGEYRRRVINARQRQYLQTLTRENWEFIRKNYKQLQGAIIAYPGPLDPNDPRTHLSALQRVIREWEAEDRQARQVRQIDAGEGSPRALAAIVGSRGWRDAQAILRYVEGLDPGTRVVSGGALGADAFAEAAVWLRRMREMEKGLPTLPEPLIFRVSDEEWRQSRAAGMHRNTKIIEALRRHPERVLAYFSPELIGELPGEQRQRSDVLPGGPASAGTRNIWKKALEAGIKVLPFPGLTPEASVRRDLGQGTGWVGPRPPVTPQEINQLIREQATIYRDLAGAMAWAASQTADPQEKEARLRLARWIGRLAGDAPSGRGTGSNIIYEPELDIFEVDADVLVNPTNLTPFANAGLARQFMERFPSLWEERQAAVRAGQITPEKSRAFTVGEGKYVWDLPTKRHFRDLEGDLELIDRQLAYLASRAPRMRELGVKRIAIPMLGTGLAKLPWEQVHELITRHLGGLEGIEVVVLGPKPKQYARGTKHHPGGPAIVGEAGPEIVRDQRKGARLVRKETLIPDLPEGSQVISTGEIRSLLKWLGAGLGGFLALGGAGMVLQQLGIDPQQLREAYEQSGWAAALGKEGYWGATRGVLPIGEPWRHAEWIARDLWGRRRRGPALAKGGFARRQHELLDKIDAHPVWNQHFILSPQGRLQIHGIPLLERRGRFELDRLGLPDVRLTIPDRVKGTRMMAYYNRRSNEIGVTLDGLLIDLANELEQQGTSIEREKITPRDLWRIMVPVLHHEALHALDFVGALKPVERTEIALASPLFLTPSGETASQAVLRLYDKGQGAPITEELIEELAAWTYESYVRDILRYPEHKPVSDVTKLMYSIFSGEIGARRRAGSGAGSGLPPTRSRLRAGPALAWGGFARGGSYESRGEKIAQEFWKARERLRKHLRERYLRGEVTDQEVARAAEKLRYDYLTKLHTPGTLEFLHASYRELPEGGSETDPLGVRQWLGLPSQPLPERWQPQGPPIPDPPRLVWPHPDLVRQAWQETGRSYGTWPTRGAHAGDDPAASGGALIPTEDRPSQLIGEEVIKQVFGGWQNLDQLPGYRDWERANTRRILEEHQTFPEYEVPISLLRATQKDLRPDILRWYLQEGVDQAHPEGGGGDPIAYFRDGELYLLEGHHRISAAVLSGAKEVKVRLANEEDYLAYEAFLKRHQLGGEAELRTFAPDAAQLEALRRADELAATGAGARGAGAPSLPPPPPPIRGGGGRSSPPSPPSSGGSTGAPFEHDPSEIISDTDLMLQALYRFVTGEPLFDVTGQSYQRGAYHPQKAIPGLTDEQAAFANLPMVPGGAPRVLTGPPGTGKTHVEQHLVLKRLREGVPPGRLPILTGFARPTVEILRRRMKQEMSEQIYAAYKASRGITTIHALGSHILNILSWHNVFGLSGISSEGQPLRQGSDFSGMTEEEILSGPLAEFVERDRYGKLVIKRGQRFTAFLPASRSHQFETFRRALAEIFEDRHLLDPQTQAVVEQVVPYVQDPLNPGKRVIRTGVGDRYRPWLALEAELKASANATEKELWDSVTTLMETGLDVDQMIEFFHPETGRMAVGSIAGKPGWAGNPRYHLAALVMQRMDDIFQRGTLVNEQTPIHELMGPDADPDDLARMEASSGRPTSVQGLVRYYMLSDLQTKPLHYLQRYPEALQQLRHLTGREYIISEAQDANLAQLQLIRLLAGDEGKIILSGDPQQDIFYWRGGTRRWLRLAMEAAHKMGTWVHLAQTHRFTSGMAGYLNAIYRALGIQDKSGQVHRMVTTPDLVPAGGGDPLDYPPIAIPSRPPAGIHPRGWERELIAHLIARMTGIPPSVDDLDPQLQQVVATQLTEAEIPEGTSQPGHFYVIERSNEDVARMTETLIKRKIPAIARFAEDAIKNWTELVGMAGQAGIDSKRAEQIIARGLRDLRDEERQFIDLVRGDPRFQIGKYADDVGAPYGEGALNLIKDVLRFNQYLALPNTMDIGPPEMGGLLESEHVIVGTGVGLKGGERKHAIVPSQIERLYPTITAEHGVEAWQSFVSAHVPISRGKQTILLAPEEGNIFFKGAQEYEATGQIAPITIHGEVEPPAPPLGPFIPRRKGAQVPRGPVRPRSAPHRSSYGALAIAGQINLPSHLRRWHQQIEDLERKGLVYGEGSLNMMRELRPGEQALIGERGPEFLVRGGMFYEVREPTLLEEIQPGDMVLPVDKVERAGQRLKAKVKSKQGVPAAAGGFWSKLRGRAKFWGDDDEEDYTLRAPRYLVPGDPGIRAGKGQWLGYEYDPRRSIIAPFRDTKEARIAAREYMRTIQSAGLYAEVIGDIDPATGLPDIHSTRPLAVQAYAAAGSKEMAVLGAAMARQWELSESTQDPSQRNLAYLKRQLSPDEMKALGLDPAKVGPLGGLEARTGLLAEDVAGERLNLTRPIEGLHKVIEGLKQVLKPFGEHVQRFTDALSTGEAKLGSGELYISKRLRTTGEPVTTGREFYEEHFGRYAMPVPPHRDQAGRVVEAYDPERRHYRDPLPGEFHPSMVSTASQGGFGGGGGGRSRMPRGFVDPVHGSFIPLGAGPGSGGNFRQRDMVEDVLTRVWMTPYMASPLHEMSNWFYQSLGAGGGMARARNTAMLLGGMATPPGVAGSDVSNKMMREMLNQTYGQDRGYWERLGVTAEQYFQVGAIGFAAGTTALSPKDRQELIRLSQEAAGKEEGSQEQEALRVFIAGIAPEVRDQLASANRIAAAAMMLGQDPEQAIRMATQLAAVGGVPIPEQTGKLREAMYSQILRAATTSTAEAQEFIEGMQYIAGLAMPMMGGHGFGGQLGKGSGKGIESFTKEELETLGGTSGADALMDSATLLAVMKGLRDAGIKLPQAGRALRSITQSMFAPSPSQSWVIAKKFGVIDEQGQLLQPPGTTIPTMEQIDERGRWISKQYGGVRELEERYLPTYDPNVYQERIRRVTADFQVTQQRGQLAQTRIQLESASLETRDITITAGNGTDVTFLPGGQTRFDIQAQQIALDMRAAQQALPLQQQQLISQIGVTRAQYAIEERRLGFEERIAPLRRQQFELGQQIEQRELARSQRSILAQRAYETALFGPTGTDRSYLNYLAAQRGMIQAGQGAQAAGLATSIGPAVDAVGLQAAQTYAAIQHQRAMLIYGQSPLSRGAALEEQLRYLRAQTEFAERQFEAEDTLRGERRSIEDETLADRERMLRVNQRLEREMFEERQVQLQEERRLFELRRGAIEANIALMEQELAFLPERFALQQASYDLALQQNELDRRAHEENKREMERTIRYLEEVIPLQAAYNHALEEFMGGTVMFKGRKDLGADETGKIPWEDFITGVFGGATEADLIAFLREDLTSIVAGMILSRMVEPDAEGNYSINEAIQDLMEQAKTDPQSIIDEMLGIHQADALAHAELELQTAGINRAADAAEKTALSVTETNTVLNRILDAIKTFFLTGKASIPERISVPIPWTDHRITTDVPGGGRGIEIPYLPEFTRGLSRMVESEFGQILTMLALWKGSGAIARGAKGIAKGTGKGAWWLGKQIVGRGGPASSAAPIVDPMIMDQTFMRRAGVGMGLGAAGGLLDWGAGELGYDTKGFGSMVGGGAAMGMMIGGPWGAAIGAGLGLAAWGIQNPEEVKRLAGEAYGVLKDTFNTVKGISWDDVKDTAVGAFKKIKDLDWDSIKDTALEVLSVIPTPFLTIAVIWKNWDEIKEAVLGAWDAVKGAFGAVTDWVGERKDEIAFAVSTLWQGVQDGFSIAWSWVNERYDGVTGTVRELWEGVQGAFRATWNWINERYGQITDAVRELWDGVTGGIRGAKDTVINELSRRWDELTGIAGEIISWIKGIPDGIRGGFSNLEQLGRDIGNAIVIDPINKVVEYLNKALDKIPGIGDSTIPSVSRLAVGTGYFHGGLALLGEMGPELAYLPRGAQVLPAPRTQMTLDLMTARNMTTRSRGTIEKVEINFPNVAVIDERMLERIKAEVVRAITEVLDD